MIKIKGKNINTVRILREVSHEDIEKSVWHVQGDSEYPAVISPSDWITLKTFETKELAVEHANKLEQMIREESAD